MKKNNDIIYNSKSGILMVLLFILHINVTNNLKSRFVFAELFALSCPLCSPHWLFLNRVQCEKH